MEKPFCNVCADCSAERRIKPNDINLPISENINQYLVKLLHVKQWKTSTSVIEWFRKIEDKKSCTFVKFDIREFYPSFIETIFNKAFLFAKQHHDISNDNTRLVRHCCKSLLFSDNEAGKKKKQKPASMWQRKVHTVQRYAHLLVLISCVFLAKLISKKDCGLYRYGGLLILRNVNAQKHWLRHRCRIFVDFLDITFNLNNGTYRPHKKAKDLLFIIY